MEGYSFTSFLFALALFLSSFLLLLREGVFHEELSVSRILFETKIVLMFVWHKYGALKRFHHRDIDVGLVFLITLGVRLRQVVSYRLNLFKLLLSHTVSSILRDVVKIL